MFERILFRLFGLEERPEYGRVKVLSTPKLPAPPSSRELSEILRYLKEKHMVDGISIFTEDGTLLATTYDEDEAIHEYSLFEQVRFELDDVTHMYLRKGDWIIAFQRGGNIYIIRVPSYVNAAELAAIARDAERAIFGVDA